MTQVSRLGFKGLAAALAVGSSGCASAAGSTGVEDKARRDVPIAICRRPLAATDTTEGGGPRPEVYFGVVFPRFRGFGSTIEPAALDCVGEAVQSAGGGAPVPTVLSPGEAVIASGEEGLQLVWLRTATLTDRVGFGPLALVRARPSELDVYAIGAYRGSSRHSRFDFGRIGTTTVIVAKDEGCADVKPGTECESTLSLYLVGAGRLAPAATVTTERMQLGTMKDIGRVQTHLTTEPPVFDATSMHVKERLSVRDSGDDEVRRSEGERVFTQHGSELVANKDSLWSQVGR